MHATREVFAYIMSERIGYARVSSASQNLDAQMDALQQAGCDKIFTDKESGATSSRPGWDDVLGYIRAGDTLVITELSRMSRSLVHLLQIVQELEDRSVALHSLRDTIDSSTASALCLARASVFSTSFSPTAPLSQEQSVTAQEQFLSQRQRYQPIALPQTYRKIKRPFSPPLSSAASLASPPHPRLGALQRVSLRAAAASDGRRGGRATGAAKGDDHRAVYTLLFIFGRLLIEPLGFEDLRAIVREFDRISTPCNAYESHTRFCRRLRW